MNAPDLLLPSPAAVRQPLNRNLVIATSVVVFHVAVLWAMQNGLLRRAAEIVVPAEILTRIIEIEPPKVAPPPPPPPPRPAPKVPRPPPMPVAVREPVPTPAPNAPIGVVEPQPPAPPIPAPPAPTPPAPPAPPAPPRLVEVTQGETEYIRPPRVVYPSLSKRNGESGVVVIAVYYSGAGRAVRGSVFKSSGFERLDRAAYEAVMASQVTPFRRAGTDANTEYLLKAPINFVLE
ncbi:MAG: energy transducer TonB [Polaromonas sp.]|uniref:energy transducer TonB n=1 Tax=Polaromonas sp. TaxID=1869339 RepID=UPI00403664EE